MRKNIFIFPFLLFILCMNVYAEKYEILPSLVIEQTGGETKIYKDDLLSIDGECRCIIEIIDDVMSVFYFSDTDSSGCECNQVIPEIYKIEYKTNVIQQGYQISGTNGNGKNVKGYIDTINKDGSFCIYDSSKIYLYIEFEYCLIS